MIIEKLVLYRCIRLMYTGIELFEYTPTSPYQLIIGTNGSGKSSVIAETSPLPAARQDYLAGGYKHVWLTHENHHYELRSDFTTGSKHTFIRDGVALLTDGNQTVQKELVEQYFGYDQALHDVITGERKSRFTNMSPAQRQQWITRISNVDVSYGIGVYTRAAKGLRDTVAVREHVERRLNAEYNNVIDSEQLLSLQNRIEGLSQHVTEVMLLSNNEVKEPLFYEEQLERSLQELNRIVHSEVFSQDTRVLAGYGSLSQLEDKLRVATNTVEYTESRLSDKRKDYTSIEDLLNQVLEADTKEDNLKAEYQVLNDQLKAEFLQQLEFRFPETDYRVLLNKVKNIEVNLRAALTELPTNANRYYSRVQLAESQQQIDNLTLQRSVLTSELERLQKRLECVEHTEEQSCPSCHYKWIPGYTEQDIQNTRAAKDRVLSQINEIDPVLFKAREYVEECHNYWEAYRKVMTQITYYPELAQLQESLVKDDLIFESPNSAVNLFNRWLRELNHLSKRTDLEERIYTLKCTLERIEAIRKGGTSDVYSRQAKSLENEIQELTNVLLNAKEERNKLKRLVSVAKQLENVKTTIDNITQALSENLLTYAVSLKAAAVREEITLRQTELAKLSMEYTEKSSARDIVKSLEQDRDRALEKEQLVKTLVNELSPKTGVVADHLIGSVDDLVDQMNEFISSIWTYDMTIESCNIEEGDLDYKFPVNIRGYEKPVQDISKLSTGQADITNFTFILATYSFLGLTEMPLFLDELGATFDPKHRMRLVNFLKRLIDFGHVSQIFYISHNPEIYNTLTNAEVCIMDPSNVVEIEGSNQHVVIA